MPASEQIVRLYVMFINLCPEIFKAAFRNSFFFFFFTSFLSLVWELFCELVKRKKNWCTGKKKKLKKSLLAHDWSRAQRPHPIIRLCGNFFISFSNFFVVVVVVVPDSSVVIVKNYYCWLTFLQRGRQHPQHTLTISTIYRFWKASIISHFILETNGSRKHTLCSFSTQPDLFILYIL